MATSASTTTTTKTQSTIAVSVLQLDTHFPRIAGDVACADTYTDDVEIIRIPKASVNDIVSDKPNLIDIAPFEDAVKIAKGDVIVTSCGFLSYWQEHLSTLTLKPFISSALTAFDHLNHQYSPEEVLTLTFDDKNLTHQHFGVFEQYANNVVGLSPDMHLRQVIQHDQTTLDASLAQREIVSLVKSHLKAEHKHLVLECTNLPPYKAALEQATGFDVTDILTCIERVRKETVRPAFLTSH